MVRNLRPVLACIVEKTRPDIHRIISSSQPGIKIKFEGVFRVDMLTLKATSIQSIRSNIVYILIGFHPTAPRHLPVTGVFRYIKYRLSEVNTAEIRNGSP